MYVINKKEKIYSTVVLLSVASHRGQVWVQTQGPGPAGDWIWTYNLGLVWVWTPNVWVQVQLVSGPN